MSARRRDGTRDQAPSAFTDILRQLCRRTGARMAALVDREGETVDYAGSLDAYDSRVAAAECRLLLGSVREQRTWRLDHTEELVVRAARVTYQAVWLGEGYALVLLLPRYSSGASRRAVAQAARELASEAGLEPLPHGSSSPRRRRWVAIAVRTHAGDKRRPIAAELQGQWCELEILGRLAAHELGPSDAAYRARLKNGAELTLVREPFGVWYFEEHW